MNQEQENLVKEALKSGEVCNQWKDKIKHAFPELAKNPKIATEQWWKVPSSGILVFYTGDHKNCGFGDNGNWCEDLGSASKDYYVTPSEEELLKALVAEAERRGLVAGVKTRTPWCSTPFTIEQFFSVDQQDFMCKTNSGYYTLFSEGVWAKPGITRLAAEQTLGKSILD